MERAEEVVTEYCRKVGAKPPPAGEDGSFVLRFEGRIEIQLSPDGRDRVLMRANLPPLKRDRSRQETLHRLMRINLLLSDRKRSTLSLDSAADTPFLYDVLDVATADADAPIRSITTFVNEVAAFHKALDRSH